MLRRTNTNFTASQAHQDNDVASPRVTNTVVTQSSTDQLSQNNCNTEKTLTDAKPVKSTNKKNFTKLTRWSMAAMMRHLHQLHCDDRSTSAFSNIVGVQSPTARPTHCSQPNIPLEPTLFDYINVHSRNRIIYLLLTNINIFRIVHSIRRRIPKSVNLRTQLQPTISGRRTDLLSQADLAHLLANKFSRTPHAVIFSDAWTN
jgi:hypothetical protein